MKKSFLSAFFLFYTAMTLLSIQGVAQENDEELAAQYFQNKEFDKAVVLYEKLFVKKQNPLFYSPYLDCLIELKQYDKAEKTAKKMMKQNPLVPKFQVDLGYVYAQEKNETKSKQQYESLIKNLQPEPQYIIDVANAFLLRNLTDYSIQTYTKGKKLLIGSYRFGFELAEIYQKRQDYLSMINEYLDLIEFNDSYLEEVENNLQVLITDDINNNVGGLLKTNLLKRIQKNPDKNSFSLLLLWLSIQQKDFETAFTQAKAIDKRGDGVGENVFSLARIAASNGDYATAGKAYEYIILKGPENYYYLNSKIELLNTKYVQITSQINYTVKDLTDLETIYFSTIKELGKSISVIPMMKDLAHLEAFYLHNTEQAKTLLNEATAMNNAPSKSVAECKIELADILLMAGDVWEATLLYSQVEKNKAFTNEPIGHLAKYKNAKLSYYIGEFDWAKAQLNVLKAATSKLIANDAMALALLISDNTESDPDTTFEALHIYSSADLLVFQNKDKEALMTLDSINVLFPGHSLSDEVLYKKAEIKVKEGLYNEADTIYTKITTDYPADILADDALFKRAQLYQFQFANKIKAMEIYQEILTKYPASLFVIEARKQFRLLRGDQLNE